MRISLRLMLASGGALLLSLVSVPLAQARQGVDDPATSPSGTTTETETHTGADNSTTPTSTSGTGSTQHLSGEKMRAIADDQREKAKELVDKAKADAEKRLADAESKSGDKLETAKLRVCQNHEKSIDDLMSRIGDRGSRHIELIDTISTRIQQYVTTNKLIVPHYSELLASVASAKATAQSANDAVKATQPTFKCDGTDPTGAAASFKDLQKARDAAVKAYRDTVKALLTAVKETPKPAKPTPTPPAPATTPGAASDNSTSPNSGGVQ